jgi:hypothetical protein
VIWLLALFVGKREVFLLDVVTRVKTLPSGTKKIEVCDWIGDESSPCKGLEMVFTTIGVIALYIYILQYRL